MLRKLNNIRIYTKSLYTKIGKILNSKIAV